MPTVFPDAAGFRAAAPDTFTALAAGRDQLLRQRGWDVAVGGMAGAPALRVFVTAMHHVSIDRALRYLGIGSRQLTVLPVAADGRLEPATLEAALAASDSPAIVALNAGDLNLVGIKPGYWQGNLSVSFCFLGGICIKSTTFCFNCATNFT